MKLSNGVAYTDMIIVIMKQADEFDICKVNMLKFFWRFIKTYSEAEKRVKTVDLG